MAAEAIVEGARAVQEHPGDRSGTQTATPGAPRRPRVRPRRAHPRGCEAEDEERLAQACSCAEHAVLTLLPSADKGARFAAVHAAATEYAI